MLLLTFLLRTVAVAIVTEGLLLVFRKRSAAFRHVIVTGGLLSGVVLCLFGYGTRSRPIAQVTTPLPPIEVVIHSTALVPTVTSSPTRVSRPVLQLRVTRYEPWNLLKWVWLTGVLLLTARLLLSFAALGRRTASVKEIDRTFSVTVMEDPSTTVPVATWWGRGMVLLPSGWRTWPESVLQSVVRHEAAHLQRGDWWLQLIGNVAATLGWFNPLVWWMKRQAQELSEQAVDDQVLSTGIPATRYAQDLLQIAVKRSPTLDSLSLPMAIKPQVSKRIEMVLNPNKRRGAASLAVILGTSALYVLFTAGASMWALVGRQDSKQVKAVPTTYVVFVKEYSIDKNFKAIRAYDPTAFLDDPRAMTSFHVANGNAAQQLVKTLHGKLLSSPIVRTLDGQPATITFSQEDGTAFEEKVTLNSGATYKVDIKWAKGMADKNGQIKDILDLYSMNFETGRQGLTSSTRCLIWSDAKGNLTLTTASFKIE